MDTPPPPGSHHRLARQRRTPDSDGECLSLAATLADHGYSPFDQAAQHQLRERVEAALREVPEAFRTVVVLREIEGFTYEEIAEILQTNLGTVKSRLTRGRAALRTLLCGIELESAAVPQLASVPADPAMGVTR